MSDANRHLSHFHRVIAVVGVVLVILLNVCAASPQLHAWLHGHEPVGEHGGPGDEPVGDSDHECAVTLFAHGTEALLVFCLLMLVRLLARSTIMCAPDLFVVVRPYYWLVPSHAPPMA